MELSLALAVVNWTIRIVLGARVIMRGRPVGVSLAWLAVIMGAPIAGAVLYALVGENRLGARRLRRILAMERRTRDYQARIVALWRHHHFEWNAEDGPYAHLPRLGTLLSGTPPLTGNALELINDTDAFIAQLVRDIDAARHHVHLLYYIWCTDAPGEAVTAAVERARGRGVVCRILVDAVGSSEFLDSPMAERLRAAGAEVVGALPVRALGALLARVDLRNHRKIAVIDGLVALTGSQNVTDARYKFDPRVGPFLEASVRVRGPAVSALQTVFLHDWRLETEADIADLGSLFPELGPAPGPSCVVHVVPSGPGPEPETIHEALLTAVYAAREEFLMTTPYFVPDESLSTALKIAARRGVDVTLIIPARLDMPLVAAAARAHYADLLRAGVKIMRFDAGMLHSKTVTIDRRVGIITSANFDMRSFFLNYEVSLFVYDDDFASVLRFMQTGYLEHSVQLHAEEWDRRPFLARLRDGAARLLSPLL